ncbi:hypothetical protein F2Q68_00010090 [Brassica cretica]|uniref:Uncharacterized protein n=1 Tax=Brassica cretica TaxID=69181 RepID=A0A8S9KXI7_BRACR|nr:hypothetical protein F2Q68_00010090 [Brassica cretica]
MHVCFARCATQGHITYGLLFPIPEPILNILVELGLSLTQMCPNFLRHLLALLVKAHLVLMKRNSQNPGTFLMSPRPGRQIIQGVPYRDQDWREEFFVFKIDEASVGSSDFSRLPRYWAEDIVHSWRSDMTDGLRGLVGALQRGRSDWSCFDNSRVRAAFWMSGGSGVAPEIAGASEDEAEHSQEEVQAPSSNPPPCDRLERHLARTSSFRTSRSASVSEAASGLPPISIVDSNDEGAPGGRQSPVSLSPGLQDDSVVAGRKRRRLSKAVVPELSRSGRKLKGWKLVLEGDGPLSMDRGDLISLAQRTRSADCRPPSLVSPGEEEAYAKVVSASSKVVEAFKEFTVTMEDRIRALRNEGEVEKGKAEVRRLTEELRLAKEEIRKKTGEAMLLKDEWQRARRERAAFETEVAALRTKVAELETGHDRDIRRGSRAARRKVADGFREVIASLEKRWLEKQKEVSAGIQLHELVANLYLLTEIKNEGLVVDEEIDHQKEMEKDFEAIVGLAAVPDWSVAGLNLPQVSEDSIVNDAAVSSSYGEGAKQIRSGDVSEALTEVLREETRLPRSPAIREGKDLGGEKVIVRTSSNSPNGLEGRDDPPKKTKVTGADHRPGVSGDSVVAKPFHWQFSHSKDCPITEDPSNLAHLAMEANNEFAATLERRLQDVTRSDELYEIKKVVQELNLGLKMAQDRERVNAAQLAAAEKLGNQAASFEARLRVVSNERKSALEQVSFLEAKIESSAGKFADDLRHATYDAKKALADNYLDVLISLKEKWEKKKAAANYELLRLRAKEVELGSELDVMAVSDFSVGKLELSQISEDLPEEFFAKVPSEVKEAGDEARCAGD